MPSPGWPADRRRGRAAQLVGPWPAPTERNGRRVALCEVLGPSALVLGSAQGDGDVDAGALAARGIAVVHRNGGGGAVLVAPDAQVWVEIWLPRSDPLWVDDIVVGAQWVGDTWVRALDACGARDLQVHRDRATRTPWSDAVCFAGIGPGEVRWSGRKVVGLSQRRTREGVRMHTVAPLHWDAVAVTELVTKPARTEDGREVVDAAAGLDLVVDGACCGGDVVAAVERAVLAALP